MKATKKMIALALTIALALSLASPAAACCGVYVGSGVSANGSTYMGRSEDIGDLYGKVVFTAFYTYLRPEQKFEDAAALRAAIARDAQTAREYFKNLK